MAQRLLDEQQSNQTNDVSTGDFSTLAWKFNNLNSTAKMLLVGASPSSVPFIPISELANSDHSSVSTYQTPDPNSNLSISSLSNPSIATKQPNFYANSKTVDNTTYTQSPFPKVSTKQSETLKSETSKEAPFKTGSYAESSPKVGSPVAAKEQVNANRNIPLTQEAALGSNAKAQEAEPEIAPEAPQKQEAAFDNTFNVASTSPDNLVPIEENLEQVSVSTPSWSYKGIPAEEEEEYYSLKEELSKKQNKAGVGPFLRGTVKSAAIISLIALLGFGAYNLLKKSPEQDIENYINDQDEFDEELNTTPLSDRVEQVDGSGLSSKTFFEEESSFSSTNESSNEISSNSNSTDSYYQPVVRSKPKTIKPSKPKVYTSPSRTAKPKTSTQQSSSTTSYSTSSNPYSTTNTQTSTSTQSRVGTNAPTAFLYDPSTIYDSSSSEAISPITYTAERFPIEISYAKSSSLYEAPLNPYNRPSTQENNNVPNFDASSYVPAEATNEVTPQETVNSGYPTFQTSPYKQQGVTENNQNNQETPQGILQDTPTSGKLESIPVVTSPSIESSSEINPTYPQVKTPANYQNAVNSLAPSSAASQAIYSKPVSDLDKELDIQANQDDMDLSVPILRQPVQSSSNNVKELNLDQPLPSPYDTNTPLTTSNFVTQDSNKVQLSSSQTQPQKGRISRFLDRFKSKKQKRQRPNLPSRAAQKQAQRSYQNQISSIEKRAQSPNLTDFERQKLLTEIEELKGKIVSNNDSAQRSINLNRRINNLEKDANSVYVEPSPYNSNQSGSDDTTLNIS